MFYFAIIEGSIHDQTSLPKKKKGVSNLEFMSQIYKPIIGTWDKNI